MLTDVYYKEVVKNGAWWDFKEIMIFIHLLAKEMTWIGDNKAEREAIKTKPLIIIYFKMGMYIFIKETERR